MSKTLGNTIDLAVLYRHFAPDMIRYFVLREMAFGHDGDFTYEALIDRVNSDLADGLGNLASRTLTMVRNYFEGTPPRPGDGEVEPAELGRQIRDVRDAVVRAKERFDAEFNEMNFSRGLEAVWSAVAQIDKFITDNQPWQLAKDAAERPQLEAVIATAYEALRHIVLLVAPAMPHATRSIWQQMGLDGEPLRTNPRKAAWGEPLHSVKVGQISPAFPKLAKDKIMAEIEKERALEADAAAATPASSGAEAPGADTAAQGPVAQAPGEEEPAALAPLAPGIVIEDFAKVDLRVATVLEAERIPKADKLLRLQVDLGEEKPRQILAGIAAYYAPEQLIGKRIIVVANLAPRKLRGLESNGMLLAASVGEEGKPVLATFAEDVPNGARLK